MKHQIAKLVTNGFYKEALNLYTHHHSTSLLPHKFTFPPLFKACAKLKSPTQGQIIHAHLIKSGFSSDVYATNSLIGMYTKLNILSDALKVFDEMPDRNLVSLTSAISVFAHNGYLRQALRVFKEAMVGTFRPDSVTVVSALSACESVDHVLQMHCLAIKLGVEMHVYVANSLMTMYSNKKEIILATRVFGEMPEKDVVSYNALFTGLLNNGVPLLVLKVFKDMKKCLSEAPNSVTFISVISTCANLSYLQFGRQVHGLIQKIGMQSDTKVGTALVDMYSKCGCLPWAHNVFQELNGSRDILTWNSMISGMMLNGQSSKAMELFDQLAHEGFKPNSSTWNSMIREFSQQGMGFESFKYFQKMQLAGTVPSLTCILSVLSSCARYSALKCGKETHGHVIRTELNKDEFVATTLIYMYMKCGQPAWARRVFDQFEIKPDDPAFWSAMMSGYRMNGDYESAVEVFDLMQEEKAVRMSSLVRKRLIRDFKRLQYDPPAGISGAPQDNNTVLWNAVVFGPDDTPWDGGTFKLTLQFIEGYPNKLPTVHFVSRMFHPNIFADGSICLDILQNQWSPIYDVVAILTSIQSLLCDPNPNSLANLEAAQMFSENKLEYNRKIREMVEQSWIAD